MKAAVIVDDPLGAPDDADGRPVSRHVACPTAGGAFISIETLEGKLPIRPPDPPTAVERAMLRRRHDATPSAITFETVEGILEAVLLGDVTWEQAVLASRSVGAFRLPPTVSVPWREKPLAVHELQAFGFVDVCGAAALNLLVLADKVSDDIFERPLMMTMHEQLQVVLAPSGLVERVEREQLLTAVERGDAAFDEIERG